MREKKSPSSRRAWIEIGAEGRRADVPAVALLAEGVDRNYLAGDLCQTFPVALLAEGVDRNLDARGRHRKEIEVALLAEGVDRNRDAFMMASLISRRPPHGGRG